MFVGYRKFGIESAFSYGSGYLKQKIESYKSIDLFTSSWTPATWYKPGYYFWGNWCWIEPTPEPEPDAEIEARPGDGIGSNIENPDWGATGT